MSVAGRRDRLDVHQSPAVAAGEADVPLHQGEQRVVTPAAHTGPRVEPGAALDAQ